jgi:hypothetical protein
MLIEDNITELDHPNSRERKGSIGVHFRVSIDAGRAGTDDA